MKHKAMTDEEIEKSGLMEPGIYDFTIASAEEKVSSKGKDMFALKHHVYDAKGEAHIVYDWVLPEFPKKYKHLHDCLGILDKYESGETKADDLVGKSGKLDLTIGKPYADNNGLERINNSVNDYIKRKPGESVKTGALPKEVDSDEIPF